MSPRNRISPWRPSTASEAEIFSLDVSSPTKTSVSDCTTYPLHTTRRCPSGAPFCEPLVLAGKRTYGLPDVFLWVQLRAFGRQRHDGDVAGHAQVRCGVPSGLIEQQRDMAAGRDLCRDRCEMQVHRLGVAPRQNEADRLALRRADGAKNVGRSGALVVRRRGAGSALGPAASDLVLLADASLVAEPDLYLAERDALGARDLRQDGREFFLKSSIAPVACA